MYIIYIYIYICILYIYIIYTYIFIYELLLQKYIGIIIINWHQFVDDAAVISGLEKENQILLNLFSRWCSWADMIR